MHGMAWVHGKDPVRDVLHPPTLMDGEVGRSEHRVCDRQHGARRHRICGSEQVEQTHFSDART